MNIVCGNGTPGLETVLDTKNSALNIYQHDKSKKTSYWRTF